MGNLDTALKDADSAMFNPPVNVLSDSAERELAAKEREFIRDVVDACREHPYPLFLWIDENGDAVEFLSMAFGYVDYADEIGDEEKIIHLKEFRDQQATQFADYLSAALKDYSNITYVSKTLIELDLEEYLEA